MNHMLVRGDSRRLPIAGESVHCVVTSPPYFGLRDYGTAEWVGGDAACDHGEAYRAKRQAGRQSDVEGGVPGSLRDKPVTACKCGARRVDRQIGLEATPDEFCAAMVAVFREVRRVLHPTGTVWLNLGDSYAGSWGNQGRKETRGEQRPINGPMMQQVHDGRYADLGSNTGKIPEGSGLKPKDLIGIPWSVAFALRADGWYLRDAIVWAKAEVDDDNLEGSAMPGSQRDRCTFAYEMMFQLAKSPRYYFDAEAVKAASGAKLRNVWRINPESYPGAHYATFPRKLVEPCIKAGTSEKGCCPECLAPWVRVVERAAGRYDPSASLERIAATGGMISGGTARCTLRLDGEVSRSTLGWRPSCSCDAGEPIPCTVLDPFNGSGTTGVVATALNRRYVGVDLSADYLGQARRRIERPHARVARKDAPMPLFAGAE